MAFVFEAKKLPFDATEDAAITAHVIGWIGEEAAHALTSWQRCLLTAVMPVVLQRPSAAARVRVEHKERDEDVVAPSPPPFVENKIESGELIDRENALVSALRSPDADDVSIALRILGGLDDLEGAYAHAVDVRQTLRRQRGVVDEQNTVSPALTAEQVIMAELLRERGGDEAVAGFFAVTRPLCDSVGVDGEDGGAEQEDDGYEADVDLAMCFDLLGNPIGMGAPSVFGGHGYHPN